MFHVWPALVGLCRCAFEATVQHQRRSLHADRPPAPAALAALAKAGIQRHAAVRVDSGTGHVIRGIGGQPHGGPPDVFGLADPLLSRLEKLDAFRGLFTGRRTLTPEQVRSAFNVSRYSSHKVREAIGLEFTPIREVVEKVAAAYLADQA